MDNHYPLTFSVDYADRLGRASPVFRLILAVPILVIVGSFDRRARRWPLTFGIEPYFRVTVPDLMTVAGLLVLSPLLMILLRRKYPRWWFDWDLQLLRLHNRINVYLLLLRDEYPSTDEDQADQPGRALPGCLSPCSRW